VVGELAVVDLTDLDTFADGFPHEVFRRHRTVAPVWWHPPTAHTPDGEGFWSVATSDEVLEVLNDPVTFSSETGGDRPYGGTVIHDLPVAGVVLNMMDDPRHGSPIRTRSGSTATPIHIWPWATACTSVWVHISPASKSASRSRRSSTTSTRSLSLGHRSGRAATGTRGSVICRCGCTGGA
jgi:hypothetical protein